MVIHVQVAAIYVLAVRTTAWVTGRPPHWAAAVWLLVMPLWMFPMVRWDERERFGGRQRWEEYLTAVRKGALPPAADPDEWLSLLKGRLSKVRGARRVVYLASGVLLALWATLMILGRMGREGWLVGVALVLAPALAEARARRTGRRVGLLLDRLQSSAGDSAG